MPPKGYLSWDSYWVDRMYGTSEYKYNDYFIGNSQNNAEIVVPLQQDWGVANQYAYKGFTLHPYLPKGFDRNQVVGNKIELRSLDITLALRQVWNYDFETTDKFMMVRIIIAMDTKGITPDVNNIDFANARDDSTCSNSDQLLQNAKSIYSHYNLDNTGRYTVLYDEIHDIKCGRHYSKQYNKTNENAEGKLDGGFRTLRGANENLYQFACEEGAASAGDQRALNALLNIHLNQEGDLAGALPPDAVYVGTIDDQFLTNSYLKFGKVFVQPGQTAGGTVVQDQGEIAFAINPIRHLWRMDTSEWHQKIHIDFDNTLCMLQEFNVAGQDRMYFEDYGMYLAFQIVSRTDAMVTVMAESRLTYWDN